MNLKEFARLVGLSQTTVSRALSGYPEVKPETRKRVHDEAVRLGYHPNRSATGLATGRAGAIGVVVRTGIAFEPIFSEFIGGLVGGLERQQIEILVSSVSSLEDELATYQRLAASRRVDAVIIHAPRPVDDRIPFLQQMGTPFIVHGRTETPKDYAFLDIDNFGAVKRATSHLLDLGHRRIASISGPKGQTYVEHRERGIESAFSERGLQADPSLFGNDHFTDEAGYRYTRKFLDNADPPTAVLAGSMMSALGAMRAIRALGMTLGRDISLIVHDDVFPYLNADNMAPTVSTMRSSIRSAGGRIAKFALQLLSGAAPETLQEVWPVELVLRESSGPVPQSRKRRAL
jgi:LacI family transcriptional regulator